jgi:alpha-tubulin suppressor-like RCC1 family protein
MSTKYPAGVIKSAPVVPSGPYQNSSASGVWTLEQAGYWIKQGNWPTAGNLSPYGGLYSWGDGINSQLGLDNITDYSSPKQVGALATWSAISASLSNSSVGVRTNGTLWSWGMSGDEFLNPGANRSSPKQVGVLTTWANSKVSSAYYSVLILKIDGTLWGWGANTPGGVLGQNNITGASSPIQVGLLTNWSNVASNNYNVIATKTDGTLWTWGYNNLGQLGLGTSGAGTYKSSPNQVGALTNWSKVASGYNHSIAIKTDGTLWSWGQGSNGKLGLGNTTNYSSPKQVGALTTWLNISAGYQHSIAIKTDGTLWSWGQGGSMQLGLGDATNRSSPVQVGALTTWSKISCGTFHALATKTDGTLWSWGSNDQGQLGLGNITNRSSPVQVGALTSWLNISAGNYHSLSILS